MAFSSKTWTYTGRDGIGQSKSGSIDAPTAIVARVKLRKRGITPTRIVPKARFSFFKELVWVDSTQDSVTQSKKIKAFSKAKNIHDIMSVYDDRFKTQKKTSAKIKNHELTVFIKQFAVVIKSGVPLLRAFDIVIRGLDNAKLVAVLEDIKFGVENGLSLAESFGSYPSVFENLFVNFLAIGEQGGILEILLMKYVAYRERMDKIRRRVKSALVYPVIILTVAAIVLTIILGFVVPRFQKIFDDLGAKLPTPTLIVIAMSHFVVKYWWTFAFIIIIAVVVWKFLYRTVPKFRFIVDTNVFRIPLFGELLQQSIIARWCRTLALLFAAGVPLNESLGSIALLVNNYLYGAETLNIKRSIEGGSSLYNAIEMTRIFPKLLVQMVSVGEEAGSLDYLLQSIADYYEQELEMVIDALLAMLEPLTIILLGAILGAIIIALYLPLFNLGNAVG